ncbi:MAG: paraquat-inducible protein A [Steroidobacteraceae bacterium]
MSALRRSFELGLILCRTCGRTHAVAALPPDRRCSRCGNKVVRRIAHSHETTLAWLLAGMILYIPANVLPVMHTSSLLGDADSTILDGILGFWRAGDWDIALLIFTASVAVPLTKFIAIGLLLYTTRAGSRWQLHERARLYRAVEFIGYWSMLDVIVVALTSALMQFAALGTAEPRIGIAFFCAVVVITMLAALSFDPRLIWDVEP